MKMLVESLAVGVGGFFGAIARWAVALGCARVFGTAFPVGTLLINLSGSFFLGWFVTVIGHRFAVSDVTRMAVAVGFVGAYTTFSTFCLETNDLHQQGSTAKAAINIVASVVLGLIAVRLGIQFGSKR